MYDNQSGVAADEPVHVGSESELEALIDDDGIVLVDYYADWCGPCKMLEPAIERLAAETPATIAKVDVDEQQAIAAMAGIQGVPTLELYVDGREVKRLVGVHAEDELRTLIEQYAA